MRMPVINRSIVTFFVVVFSLVSGYCSASAGAAMQAPVLTLAGNEKSTASLSDYLAVWVERDRDYSVKEVSDSLGSRKLRTGSSTYGASNAWVMFALHSAADLPVTWRVTTDRRYGDVTAYIIHDDGKTEIQNSGWDMPPDERSVPGADVAFNVALRDHEHVKVFLHIHTDPRWAAMDSVRVSIISAESWNVSRLKDYNFLSVYAGICLLAIFYWLIHYLFSRRVNYLYLIAATASALLFCLDIYGITSVFWSHRPYYFFVQHGQHYLWFPLMIVSHFALSYKANSFISHFRTTTMYCYWGFCFITVAFFMLAQFVLPWKYAHAISLVMTLICMVFGVAIISVLLLRRGFGSTGFAFLAILPIFLGIGVYIMTEFGLLASSTIIFVPIGALCTVIMYFYGMVHYVRVLREKRQTEIMKNDTLIREQNAVLEQSVTERTRELKTANSDLSRALTELEATHNQLITAEKQKANEQINMLLKEQELRLVSSMIDVQEKERRRIASDLHDRLGSMLSTVKLYFGALENDIVEKQHAPNSMFDKASNLLDDACGEVRRISHDLESDELMTFGLLNGLKQLAQTIEATGWLRVSVLDFGFDNRLDATIEIGIYRILQELLNNVMKHAKATSVQIQLNRVGEDLNIIVEDDGVGFDLKAARAANGMGLSNIETRVGRLNGRVQFDTGRGKGTTVIIDLKL